ncbi:hypothetical protein ZWY2020_017905 [Hordeum vulgare]|nr:hypothetical protein ZWY2020_017905 [Hordeum vulgare]
MTSKNVGLVVGRDDEIDRVISILCRKTKNCAALVGHAGVGKTAIAEGLAQRIATGKVPAALAGARVIEIDLGGMVAGAVLRSMFEERMKSVIKQAENAGGKIILFINEMHDVIPGAGDSHGNTDASSMLKPALASGQGAHRGAKRAGAVQATIGILRGLKQQYEQHHGLEIQDAALVAAAQLAARYITDIVLLLGLWNAAPQKQIEAGSQSSHRASKL